LLCLVALATSPLFVVHARMATEVTSLLPLLVLGGIALVLRATLPSADERRTGRLSHSCALFAFAGGFGVGLAAFTHVIGIILPFALAASCAILWRGRLLRQVALWWSLFGLAAGSAPRWVQLLLGNDAYGFETRLAQKDWAALAEDLASLPGVLRGVIDGDLLYLRTTGHLVMSVLPYASVVMVGLAFWRLARVRALPLDAREKVLSLLLPILLLGVFLASPWFSLLYFTSVGIVACLWCGVLVDRLLRFERGRVARVSLRAALPVLITGNVAYVGTNYYYGFASTGGVPSVFPVGKQLIETSNDFVRSDTLAEQLVGQGVAVVFAKDFIVASLVAYHWLAATERRFSALVVPPGVLPDIPPELATLPAALVYHNGLMTVSSLRAYDPRGKDVLMVGSERFVRDDSFDPHFLVYLNDAARRQ
jgi:hypothetical protein